MKIKRIKNLIAGTAKDLKGYGARLAFRRQRWQHFTDLAHDYHKKSKELQKKADKLRAHNKPGAAAKLDRQAINYGRKAKHAHDKAIVQLQKVKKLNQERKKLKGHLHDLQDALHKAQAEAGAHVNGAKVVGGSPEQRLKVAMLTAAHRCAAGQRRNYYSQSGSYDVQHALTSGPSGRSDCSSEFTSWYWACDLPDPNDLHYSAGFTGTIGSNGHHISESEARSHSGAAVLFGTYPFHHIEGAIGDGSEHTIGHGSAPVDMGTFDLLPGPRTFIKFT